MKSNNKKRESSFKRLMKYAGKFKFLTAASLVLSVVSAWTALLPFYYIWKIVKTVIENYPEMGNAGDISHYGWCAVGFALLSMLIYICALMCSHIAAFRVQANMRTETMQHILTLPAGFMEEEGSGRIRKIVNESSAATETYLAHQLPDRAGAIATPVGLLVMLVSFDWRLGLLSIAPVFAAFAIMGTMTGEKMKKKMKEYQNALEDMSNEAVEYVRGIPVVKTFGQSVFSFRRFKAAIDNYQKWVISYTLDLRLPMVFYTVIINAVFAVLIAAAFWLGKGGADGAFLTDLIFYIIITPIITVTLNKIMFSSENAMVVEDAIMRIDSIMNMKPLESGEGKSRLADYSVSFENVSFRYNPESEEVLKNISFKVKNGEHIAFVGPSGGGKSTLASLVVRFNDVSSGSIKIGGADIREMDKEVLMDTVSFVFQDSRLLKTSIFENVRLARPDASRQQVLDALEKAQCNDIIEKLPQGIDTVIGSKGTYVSGGQAQRIAIARAILKNAPVLILDEATAFADPDNELKIQKALGILTEGKTVIMIAHRLSTVAGADRIIVLKDGHICESGAHDQLKKAGGLYEHMWKEYSRAAEWKIGGAHNEFK